MKKLFKFLGILVLLLIVIFLVMSLVQPKDATVERSIVIKAPQHAVFEQVSKFKNWPNWSPWIAMEPKVKLSYMGTDGTAGSGYHWLGDETGEGEMTNTGIEKDKMTYDLRFIKPWEGKAEGAFKTEDLGDGQTRLTWTMIMHANWPMNAMNFMTDKMVGKDFEKGLDMMKQYVEAHPGASAAAYAIESIAFPATYYATIRKNLPAADMMSFFSDSYQKLFPAAGSRVAGNGSAIIYVWDEQSSTTDIAVAVPVTGTAPVKDAVMVSVPASPAYRIVYTGGYAGSGKAHQALEQHVAAEGKIISYVIEEYVTDPSKEPDSNKWVTNISYVVQ